MGINIANDDALRHLAAEINNAGSGSWTATPLVPGAHTHSERIDVTNPADRREVVGHWQPADAATVERAMENALAAQPAWDATPVDARRWLSKLGAENTYLVIRLKYADCLAHDKSYHRHLPRLRAFKAQVDAALRRRDCYTLSGLAVSGRDVNRALGIAPSERTGALLRALLDAVIEGICDNRKDDLLELAAQLNRMPELPVPGDGLPDGRPRV